MIKIKRVEELTNTQNISLATIIISALFGGGLLKIIQAFYDGKKSAGTMTIEMIVKSAEMNQKTIDEYKAIADGWKKQFEELEARIEKRNATHEKELLEMKKYYERKLSEQSEQYRKEIARLEKIISTLKHSGENE